MKGMGTMTKNMNANPVTVDVRESVSERLNEFGRFKDTLSYRVLDVMSEITLVYETYW